MNITMDDSRITSIAQLRDFLNGSQRIVVSLENSFIEEKYQFIEKTVKQFLYRKLKKKDKKIVVLYLRKITGYKKAQLYKLICYTFSELSL
jgi:TPP-dependent indolepyruvate ferredoxin oxidoreductase alpha subunit